jgi:DNA-binding response OmpR family regulator
VLGRKKDDQWDGTDRRSPPAVLIVSDDPAACEMLVRMVATRGYRAFGATSPDDAMWRVGSELPRCIVLDLNEGGVAASLRVLDAIRSHDDLRVSTARVILCATSAGNRSFSFQSGADAFLVRPFHIDELTDEIAGALARAHEDRSRHRRDELARHGD